MPKQAKIVYMNKENIGLLIFMMILCEKLDLYVEGKIVASMYLLDELCCGCVEGFYCSNLRDDICS